MAKMTVVTTKGRETTGYTVTDEQDIYKSLANDLIEKKMNNCSYIKSITRVNNYNGTQTITVKYNNCDMLNSKVTRVYVIDVR